MTPPARHRDLLLYDGACGLCDALVRFALARDARHLLDSAPLQGPPGETRLDAARRALLPDSVVVVTGDGVVLTRSRAVAHVLRCLGGGWGALGSLLALLPARVADAAYDAVAARRALVGRRPAACRVPPPTPPQRPLA